MKDLQDSSHLYGSNAPFVEELYERYLADPSSVPDSWRSLVRAVAGERQRQGRRRTAR